MSAVRLSHTQCSTQAAMARMCVLCRVVLTGNVTVFVLTSLVGPSTHGVTCLSAQAVLQRLQGEACVMHAAPPDLNMHTGQLYCL